MVRTASQQQALGVGPESRKLYKLHLYEDRTAVLVTATSSRDVQTVYEKPSYDSKKLGREQRSVIEVEEVKTKSPVSRHSYASSGVISCRPSPVRVRVRVRASTAGFKAMMHFEVEVGVGGGVPDQSLEEVW